MLLNSRLKKLLDRFSPVLLLNGRLKALPSGSGYLLELRR